jgi:hypothetical protein
VKKNIQKESWTKEEAMMLPIKLVLENPNQRLYLFNDKKKHSISPKTKHTFSSHTQIGTTTTTTNLKCSKSTKLHSTKSKVTKVLAINGIIFLSCLHWVGLHLFFC